jgi:phage terminase large subunit-like protein
MSVAPKSVTINLDNIACDAAVIAAETEQLDEIVERLRDLADPRIPLPDRATLGERLREWAADLEQASVVIWGAADGIEDDIRDALDEDEDEDDGGGGVA